MPAKLTAEDYHRVAKEKGVEWIGPEVPNVKTRTQWECHCGNTWWSTYGAISKNKGNCPKCGKIVSGINQRVSPDAYRLLAKDRGFLWLGPKGLRSTDKTLWQCSQGHQWKAAFHTIKQGNGCPTCGGNRPITQEDYHTSAKENGIEWVGRKLPRNSHTHTIWKCKKGHTWRATFQTINHLGRNCPHCAGQTKKTESDYYELARRRGIEWVGTSLPPNVSSKTLWRCAKGHTWTARYYSIDGQGTGCPKCADFENGQIVSQLQRDLFAMLKHLPKAELNTPYGRFYLDITFELEGGINVDVEYDSWHWHKDKLKQDAARDRSLIRDGWRVLRVRSGTQLPTQKQLDEALAKLVEGLDYTSIILDDWKEADKRPLVPPAK